MHSRFTEICDKILGNFHAVMYRIVAYITTVRLLTEQRKTIEEAAHNIDRVGQALEGRRRK